MIPDLLKNFALTNWVIMIVAATTLPAQTPLPDSFNPDVDGVVKLITIQADGKILIAGNDITTVAGQSHINLARLNPDGSLDNGFNLDFESISGFPSPWVDTLAIQPEGSILVGGGFVGWNGQLRTNLIRLKPDGSADTAFNPDMTGDVLDPAGVFTLVVQPDGKIFVGEICAWCPGALVRFNSDGSKDGGFFRVAEALGPQTMAIQPDGKLLFGGVFEIGRLNTNGTVDPTFSPRVDGTNGLSHVSSIIVQPDGKILIGGTFTNVAGQPRTNIARLNPDGTLDMAFRPSVDSDAGIALQADGEIILYGEFASVNGQPHVGLARLNADGSLDAEFDVEVGGPSHSVASVAIQVNGEILIGGEFTSLGGQPRTNIGRLNNTGPASQSLGVENSVITWSRGGTSPEVWRTTFESSTDGLTWTYLGAGQRIAGGWQLTNVFIAPGSRLRARGFVAGGGRGEGIVETTLPIILTSDGDFGVRSNLFGFNIGGTPGQLIVVEASTNLVQWTPVQTNLLDTGILYFSDPQWQERPRQFYRARTQ